MQLGSVAQTMQQCIMHWLIRKRWHFSVSDELVYNCPLWATIWFLSLSPASSLYNGLICFNDSKLKISKRSLVSIILCVFLAVQTCPGSHGNEQTPWMVANLQWLEGTVPALSSEEPLIISLRLLLYTIQFKVHFISLTDSDALKTSAKM